MDLNGPKIDPKWTQNGPKMDLKWTPKRPLRAIFKHCLSLFRNVGGQELPD